MKLVEFRRHLASLHTKRMDSLECFKFRLWFNKGFRILISNMRTSTIKVGHSFHGKSFDWCTTKEMKDSVNWLYRGIICRHCELVVSLIISSRELVAQSVFNWWLLYRKRIVDLPSSGNRFWNFMCLVVAVNEVDLSSSLNRLFGILLV